MWKSSESYRVKEISLCSEGEQPQTSLEIPCADAWVKLLENKDIYI